MFLVDLIIVLIIAVVLTAIISAGIGRHRGSSLAAFFIILFTLTWAVGVWVAPLGYPVMGGYWLSFLLIGILFALLLLALIPPGTRPDRGSPRKPTESATADERIIFGTFFWVLMAALAIILIMGYVVDPFPEIRYMEPMG